MKFYRILGIGLFILYMTGIVATILYIMMSSDKTLKIELYSLNESFPTLKYIVITLVSISLLGSLLLLMGSNAAIDLIYIDEGREYKGDKNLGSERNGRTKEEPFGKVSITKIEEIISFNQHDKKILLEQVLKNICHTLEVSIGAMYITKFSDESTRVLEMKASYAYYSEHPEAPSYDWGNGMIGQVAKSGNPIRLKTIPEGYIKTVTSGLGEAPPSFLCIYPIKNEEEDVLGVIEIAFFKEFNQQEYEFLQEVALLLAKEIETNEYQNLSL